MRFGRGQRAGMVIGGAVGQVQAHRLVGAGGQRGRAALTLPADDLGRRLGHVHLHRVDAADHRKRAGLAGRHQLPLRHQRQPDHPVERRCDRRAVEVDLRPVQRGFGSLHRGFGRVAGGDGGVLVLFADDVAVAQRVDPLRLAPRGVGGRGRLRQGGLGLRDRGLVAAGVDPVERLVFLDRAAFLEHPFGDDAADLWAQFRLGRGDDAAGQHRGQRHVLRLQRDHRDGGRWRRGRRRILRLRGLDEREHAARDQAGLQNQANRFHP